MKCEFGIDKQNIMENKQEAEKQVKKLEQDIEDLRQGTGIQMKKRKYT